ncbi:hypothetical protein HN51_067601 [Arachis hypogaea]
MSLQGSTPVALPSPSLKSSRHPFPLPHSSHLRFPLSTLLLATRQRQLSARLSVRNAVALRELFKKLSSSIIDDGFIHQLLPVRFNTEELQLTLLKTPVGENLFLDRVIHL